MFFLFLRFTQVDVQCELTPHMNMLLVLRHHSSVSKGTGDSARIKMQKIKWVLLCFFSFSSIERRVLIELLFVRVHLLLRFFEQVGERLLFAASVGISG